ncbi:MAG: alpha/beta hydrolase [Pseudonocardia sp.]|uniref:alpha/beta fold hydrolase n=1 Tax=unclassified Pseudonocardia TaxID=2619320 RepID=UPI00086EDD95|nr:MULTISPECIES: alpha/beta hydrolase [unclassified Pseudonocardia]MBN9107914.1 alpha/beta hydrolase [Pseudonocardia sp.]ODU25877.1 MAG: alpha/beta hydrolase [Pseudonocardia sp. SCN 72-51]ODV07400.1 MAG: alpha/beta hydrolase [Pseudonocardia sp. SCN 73-27]
MLTLVDSTTGTVVGRAEGEDVVLDVATTGAGPTLLMLHGAEGREADTAFVDALAGRFTVVAPSHPGFGLSPRPDWCDTVEDLAYLYLDWIERQDLRDVVLVGLQFGGWLAAEMAVRDCSRLGRLVLVDPVGIKVGGREDRDIVDVFAIPRGELDARNYADPAAGPGDLTLASVEDTEHIARNEEALALYGWEPYLHNPRLRRWLPRIHVPTLVAWGAHDGIVSPGYGRAYADAIPGARFEIVDGAGHRAQVEQPATLAALVADHTV